MRASAISCVEAQRALLDFRRQQLPHAGQPHDFPEHLPELLVDHLRQCESCQALSRGWTVLFEQMRREAAEPPVPGKAEAIYDRLRVQRERASGWTSFGLDRWGRLAPAAVGVALLLVVGGWILWGREGQQRAALPTGISVVQVTQLRGDVRLSGDVEAGPGLRGLEPGGEVVTGAGAAAVLKVDHHRVELRSQTRLGLAERDARTIHLRIYRGEVFARSLPGQSAMARLEIAMPRCSTVVLGTRFTLQSDADFDRIRVSEGTVGVTLPSGSHFRVTAGKALQVGSRGAEWLEPTPVPPERERSNAGEPLKSKRPRRSERSGAASIQRFETALQHADCSAAAGVLTELRSARPTRASAPLASRLAECYLSAGEIDSALSAYRTIARDHPHTVWGQTAAYEEARLLRERGSKRAAANAFARYLRSYPRGAMASEAAFWRCVLAYDLGQVNTALTCLQRYRRDYPNTARANDSLLIQGNVYRTGKRDCAAAIDYYSQYLRVAGDALGAVEAKQWLQWCQDQSARP